MAKSNERIVKKLSRRAAELLPNVNWIMDENEPHCEWRDGLLPRTPVLWYRCNYEYSEYESICAWTALKRVFATERDITIFCDDSEWVWGWKPTPANVFWWAFWNPLKLEEIKDSHFDYGEMLCQES